MKLSLLESIYVYEIVRGLWVTTSVLFSNLFKWVTFRKGALTAYYPEEMRADYSPRNRGRHILTTRENGKIQCVSCNMCATVCPARCIEIESAFDASDPHHPKSPVRFEIDYSRCIFCGFCVEACPEDAIRMSMEVKDFPAFDTRDLAATQEYMSSWCPSRDPQKKYPSESGK